VVRGYLGLHVRPVPVPPQLAQRYGLAQKHGVEVLAVESGGPAEEAGLQEGDVVITFGDQPAGSVDDLHKLLTQLPVGIPASVVVLREGRRLERLVIPTDYPNPAPRT
jgi:S1-C subfamily serine protease